MVKAFILDWDGTIVDSAPWQHEFFGHCCNRFGKSYPYQTVDEMLENFEEPFTKMYEKFGFNWQDDKARLYDLFYEFARNKQPEFFEGIDFVLKHLNGCRLGIATSNKYGVVKAKLDKFDMTRLFSCIAGFDNDKHRPKPAPDILNECLYGMNIKPEDAYYFGDQPSDILTARAAGCKAVAVGWGFAKKKIGTLLDAKPDYLIDAPEEIRII